MKRKDNIENAFSGTQLLILFCTVDIIGIISKKEK